MSFTVDPLYTLRWERKSLLYFGIYPIKNNHYAILHYAALFTVFFFSYGQFIPMLIQLFYELENISNIADITLISLTQGAYLFKMAVILSNRQIFFEIEKNLKDPILTTDIQQEDIDFLNKKLKALNYIRYTFRVTVLCVMIFYAIYPKIDVGAERDYPLNSWYPFDKTKFSGSIFLFQMASLVLSSFLNATFDLLVSALITLGAVYFRILKNKLSRIDYTEAIVVYEKQQGDCAILHKHVIQYITLIEDMFSVGIFIQFLASIGVICLTGFQMLVVPVASAQFLMLISYIMCMMCQVAMYCWYGNEILFESDGIIDACYMSNWYEGTQKSKKVLCLIMERSKRQIILTAGKFFTLSLTTLLLILKSSYSYFAVLQRVYKDE